MQQARTQAATAATQARKAEPALTLSRRYKASLERVYGAFARQVHLARWFGPEGCAIEDCDWRPQAGRKDNRIKITVSVINKHGNLHKS